MGPEWRSMRDWPVTATRRAALHIPPPWGSCNSKISSANAYLIPVSAKKTPIRNKTYSCHAAPRTPKINVEASRLAGDTREMGVFFARRKSPQCITPNIELWGRGGDVSEGNSTLGVFFADTGYDVQ